jgi:hypothetical protein
LAASIFLLTKALGSHSTVLFLVSGILFGISTLCKAVVLLLPFFLFPVSILAFRKPNPKIVRKFIFLLLAVVITVAPWTLRNYVVSHKFIPVGTGFGVALWMGNCYPSKALGLDFEHPALRAIIGQESPIGYEQDRLLRKEAIKAIVSNPREFVRLFFVKIARLWWAYDYSPGKEAFQEYFLLQNVLIFFAMFGMAYSLFHWRRTIILISTLGYFTLILAIIKPVKRHTLPLMPYVIIFAAYGFLIFCLLIKDYLIPKIHGRNGLLRSPHGSFHTE